MFKYWQPTRATTVCGITITKLHSCAREAVDPFFSKIAVEKETQS